MRINYYQFPDTVDAHTRYIHGATSIDGVGTCFDRDDIRVNDRSLGECTKAEFVIIGISVKAAKTLLRKYGGTAWTLQCDRSGSVFETTDIKLAGNNTKYKYNRHL